MEEKLQRCPETILNYKKNSLNKKLMYLPALSQISEDNENEEDYEKDSNFSSISSVLLKKMIQMQIDIENILIKYS